MTKRRHIVGITALASVLIGVGLVSFFIADLVLSNADVQTRIGEAGYAAIAGFAFVAGLNAIIPIPAVAFTPVFIAAGLHMSGVILALTIGTLASDFAGYWFGRFGRNTIISKYPKLVAKLQLLYTSRRSLLIPTLFLYAAVIPIPNEVLIIPLAVLGTPWRTMVLPLFAGNLVNQTLLAYGVQTIFLNWW
jgi:membrane protein YqaA with SNARE-associated domain